MKRYIIILILFSLAWGQKRTPFSIDIRPRVIEDAKILVNVEVVNHVGRPVDYLEGCLSEYSGDQFLGEKRMVLIYHYEPALQTGFSTTKSATFELKGFVTYPSVYKNGTSMIGLLINSAGSINFLSV